jgi:hypothetical protein
VGTGTGASCTESALTACLPGGGSFDGTVTFNCGVAATITVTSTKTVNTDTTIDGGNLITISGGHSVGVFSVHPGVNFTVQNLTIANGSSADSYAGVYNNGGTLTVTNCTFSGNSGGIFNYSGTVTVTDSTFSGNRSDQGGGISNGGSGTLTVTNSTFFGNSAGAWGGGIDSDSGTVTVINSTFYDNSAYSGGGIESRGMLTVTNSTFFGNYSLDGPGGGIFNGGTLTVTNSTLYGNSVYNGRGGGIFSYGTLTVTNTIVASSASGGNCYGAVTDGGHNIDDGTTCGFTGTGCTSTNGTSFCSTNPQLDPAGLANNGGPTQTIELLAGSPAINAGDESVCSAAPINNLDQRRYVRPGDGATSCSIGAYEYNSPGPPPPCEGDCNGDGQVTVDELLTMVNIALGNTPVTTCEAGDANHDGEITVDEILTALNNALNGCGSASTPTPNMAGA